MSRVHLTTAIRRYLFILIASLALLWSTWSELPQKATAQDAAVTPAPANTPPGSRRNRPVSGIGLNPTPFSINSRGMSREERRAGLRTQREGLRPRETAAVNAVQGTPPPQGVTKEGPAAHAGQAAGVQGSTEPPTIKYPPDALKAILHFSPDDIITREEKEFEISVTLDNRNRQPVDRFQYAIEYDPRWLKFLYHDSASIADFLENPTEGVSLLRAPGRLEFSASFKKPIADEQITLMKLRFSPAEATGRTSLRFANLPLNATAVYSGDQNILIGGKAGLTGIVQANIFIRPKPVDEDLEMAMLEAGLELPVKENNLKGWPIAPSDAKTGASVKLSLQAPEKTDISAGEDFWVDLVLYNDQLAPIDSIGAAIQFDPRAMQVIDEDEGNWITRGINVWDGGFHDTYPFDVFRTDAVDTRAGTIRYSMGRYQSSYAFPTGIFGRIHFRALAPAQATSIRLIRSAQPGDPLTYVRIYGNDRLIRTWNPAEAPSVRMRILAEAARTRPAR